MSKRSASGDTRYLRIWGTHLRWAALCHEAWEIVFSGRAPYTPSVPPIVEEYGKTVHGKLVSITAEWFKKSTHTLHILPGKATPIEYSVRPSWSNEPIILTLKPDLYVLWNTSRGPINLAIEVTTRIPTHIPEEWLTAYALGLYIRNLRPSFTVLATPEQVSILPLSTRNIDELKKLIDGKSRKKPTPSLCYNCDLRQVCPNPLV